jgi:CS domain
MTDIESKTATKNEDDMSPDERLQWLRDRGVLIETSEERRSKELSQIMNEKDDDVKETVSFVLVPHDTSKPLKELSFECPVKISGVDFLMEYLKPIVKAMSSDKAVDLELLRQNASQTLGSSDAPNPSEDTLQKVASEGSVEKFPLVHATEANNYTSVNIYLDEAGMLKRLPLNVRATDFCARAGYNPPPQFYGNVFIGRVKVRPYYQNVSFHLGKDTSTDAKWLVQATMDNLAHQTELNKLTGRSETQAAVDGTDGTEKNEDGYTWSQTEEELEVVVPLPPNATSKDVSVRFLPQSMLVKFHKEPIIILDLFEHVDPDGCTWTMDRKNGDVKLIVSLEKVEQALWPRIKE